MRQWHKIHKIVAWDTGDNGTRYTRQWHKMHERHCLKSTAVYTVHTNTRYALSGLTIFISSGYPTTPPHPPTQKKKSAIPQLPPLTQKQSTIPQLPPQPQNNLLSHNSQPHTPKTIYSTTHTLNPPKQSAIPWLPPLTPKNNLKQRWLPVFWNKIKTNMMLKNNAILTGQYVRCWIKIALFLTACFCLI